MYLQYLTWMELCTSNELPGVLLVTSQTYLVPLSPQGCSQWCHTLQGHQGHQWRWRRAPGCSTLMDGHGGWVGISWEASCWSHRVRCWGWGWSSAPYTVLTCTFSLLLIFIMLLLVCVGQLNHLKGLYRLRFTGHSCVLVCAQCLWQCRGTWSTPGRSPLNRVEDTTISLLQWDSFCGFLPPWWAVILNIEDVPAHCREGWTRWPSNVPSSPNYCMILWSSLLLLPSIAIKHCCKEHKL